MKIEYSNHSDEQNLKRRIPKTSVEVTLESPEKTEVDKYDSLLTHYIKFINGKYLRVIVKRKGDGFFVISYFYDRRLERRVL